MKKPDEEMIPFHKCPEGGELGVRGKNLFRRQGDKWEKILPNGICPGCRQNVGELIFLSRTQRIPG